MSFLQFLRKIHECTLKIRILIALMGEFISLKNVCHINFLSFIISFDLLLSQKRFFKHKLVWYYFLLIFHTKYGNTHGLRTPREEIAFTAWPKIQSQSQIFRYSRSIFCLPHRPNFSDIFDLCLHWVPVVRGLNCQ